MKKYTIAFMLFMALPVAGIAATDQTTGHVAGASIDQSHPGSTMSAAEEATSKHLAAAAAHEQTAKHHKAAADAKTEQEKEAHAKAAEKASLVACEKSKEALITPTSK